MTGKGPRRTVGLERFACCSLHLVKKDCSHPSQAGQSMTPFFPRLGEKNFHIFCIPFSVKVRARKSLFILVFFCQSYFVLGWDFEEYMGIIDNNILEKSFYLSENGLNIGLHIILSFSI